VTLIAVWLPEQIFRFFHPESHPSQRVPRHPGHWGLSGSDGLQAERFGKPPPDGRRCIGKSILKERVYGASGCNAGYLFLREKLIEIEPKSDTQRQFTNLEGARYERITPMVALRQDPCCAARARLSAA